MRKYLDEFKEFINKGDVITIAVGLVLALYFQKIVDAVVNGVINPLIAAIFGKQNFTDIGFGLNEGNRVSIGLVINAVISFLAVAIFLFLIIKAYNRMQAREEAKDPTAPAAPAPDLVLLTEIRDELRARQG